MDEVEKEEPVDEMEKEEQRYQTEDQVQKFKIDFNRHTALLDPGVNKKPKKFKTVWYGLRGFLKLSGRVNQASLKLSAGFSITVC